MRLLADWNIHHQNEVRTIQLYQGDLAALPPEHAVDILVVSSFPNDYLPTPSSLIGALYRRGICVAQLATTKQLDMRKEFSCWLSEPLHGIANFDRILCIESGWRGTPLDVADDIFRALAPSSMMAYPRGSLAMPLIGAGDQGYSSKEVIQSILRAAVFWLRRGLDLRTIKIVVRSEQAADLARKAFLAVRQDDVLKLKEKETAEVGRDQRNVSPPYSPPRIFLSYAHQDFQTAHSILEQIRMLVPDASVFFDKISLTAGCSWLMQIAESLDTADRLVALFTPHYWASKYCKDEFTSALLRQNDTGIQVLFPIFYQEVAIPYFIRSIQSVDCRESDIGKLNAACALLCKSL